MENKKIGMRIRALRKQKGMTLKQVAAQAGLTASFLSQMERNLSGVTLSSLASVAKALDVPLQNIVSLPTQTTSDTHQGKRQEYSIEDKNLQYERISSSFPGSSIHSLKIKIPVGYSSGFESHTGEELLFVLFGSVYYTVDRKTYQLEAGDSVHIDSSRSHQIANGSDTTAEILWVSTFSVFGNGEDSHF
jgi:transcriptional regulator with XRE-family HTH domain